MDGQDSPRPWERVPTALRLAGLASGCLLLVAAAIYLLATVAVRLASLSIAILAAVLITALLHPVVRGLHRARIPRGISAFTAVLLLITVLLTPVILLWRLTVDQFDDLATRLREGVDRTLVLATQVLPVSKEQLDSALSGMHDRLQRLGSDPLSGALTALEVLAAVLLALFVAFFLLKDGPSMGTWLLGELPAHSRASVRRAAAAGWDTVTGYIRGTLIVGAIDAVGIGVALMIIGVPLALPLAALVFVGCFVPYLGSTATGAVAVLVALAANGPVDALLTLTAVIAVQQLEGNFLEPVIVGRQVRLHPVAVVVVVFAGSLAAGVAGAVVAVPLTAVTYRIYRVLREPPATSGGNAEPRHAASLDWGIGSVQRQSLPALRRLWRPRHVRW